MALEVLLIIYVVLLSGCGSWNGWRHRRRCMVKKRINEGQDKQN
jgi:uncharacterized protein YceK